MEELTRDNASIEITLNGRLRTLGGGMSVSDLVASLDLQDRLVVVERNGEIVPRSEFPSIEVVEGDTLEIVHFVGGG
jgi:thiamine biosynthesis protein ThiS